MLRLVRFKKKINSIVFLNLMALGELTLQSIEKLLELLIFIFAIYLVLKNELTIER